MRNWLRARRPATETPWNGSWRAISLGSNIAVRMLGRRPEAEDATQNILIKALEGLPAFRGDSRFRTWLYRIAANHILNLKRDKWAASDALCSFATAAQGLGQVPDLDLPDPRTVPVSVEIGVTSVNFRQILSRARRDLYEYLRGNCSLVNPNASCKCVRKTRAFIAGGFLNPRNRASLDGAGRRRLPRPSLLRARRAGRHAA